MSEPKMGGKKRLRLFVAKEEDITNALLSISEGGAVLEHGLRDLVREKYHGEFDIDIIHDSWDRLFYEQVDLLALSIRSIVLGDLPVEKFTEDSIFLIRRLKQQADAHVTLCNCSSVDLDDNVANYHGQSGDTFSVRVHRFNLALMKLSELEGISIIDVERLVAQLGGEHHVPGRLSYSREAHKAICREFLRVMEDIGFFENRPLVMQIGRKEA